MNEKRLSEDVLPALVRLSQLRFVFNMPLRLMKPAPGMPG